MLGQYLKGTMLLWPVVLFCNIFTPHNYFHITSSSHNCYNRKTFMHMGMSRKIKITFAKIRRKEIIASLQFVTSQNILELSMIGW